MTDLPELNAIVTQRQEVSSGLIILQVATLNWELPTFSPGQFAVLGLPAGHPRCLQADPDGPPMRDPQKLIRRAYSISSGSRQREFLEFYITLISGGALTPRLFELKPGDRLWLGPRISGLFTLDRIPADQDLLMIGTGTGIAPYMSMLRTCLAGEQSRRYCVVHGARHSWDLGYRSELTAMMDFCPHFAYLPALSRPEAEHIPWQGAKGRIQEVWQSGAIALALGRQPRPQDTHILLCGNPLMIEEMVTILTAGGWQRDCKDAPGTIHLEEYW